MSIQSCGMLAPLYTVKAFENGLYRVSKRLCAAPRPCLVSEREKNTEKPETSEKFASARRFPLFALCPCAGVS